MKRTSSFLIACSTLAGIPLQSAADVKLDENGLRIRSGHLTIRGRAALGLQGAVFNPTRGDGSETSSEFDASGRFIIEYEAQNGIFYGIRGEYDTGRNEIANFERDEIYAYVSTQYGLLEVGENDGPADTMSFHAPTVGHGQVRGDFARYTGSVALLTPYDSRDAFKVSYYTPPINGLRAGVSYSPEFTVNADAQNPRSRRIQSDVIELGVQYVRPFGDWIAGISGAYVTGQSDTITDRANLRSWSVGVEARRGNLILGGAFVDRNRSDLRFTADTESEWNIGAAWRENRWRLAASFAVTREGVDRENRYGVGGEFDITDNLYIRADFVRLITDRPGRSNRNGWVAVSETGLRF